MFSTLGIEKSHNDMVRSRKVQSQHFKNEGCLAESLRFELCNFNNGCSVLDPDDALLLFTSSEGGLPGVFLVVACVLLVAFLRRSRGWHRLDGT